MTTSYMVSHAASPLGEVVLVAATGMAAAQAYLALRGAAVPSEGIVSVIELPAILPDVLLTITAEELAALNVPLAERYALTDFGGDAGWHQGRAIGERHLAADDETTLILPAYSARGAAALFVATKAVPAGAQPVGNIVVRRLRREILERCPSWTYSRSQLV
jgi:hypothetical protein